MDKLTLGITDNPVMQPRPYEIIERKGLDEKAPRALCIEGNIKAPAEIMEKWKENVDVLKSYLVVSPTDGTIQLEIDAQNPIPKTVIGRLEVSQVLKDLGLSIETGLSKDTVGKDQKEMLVFLRKFRRYFETSEIYQKCEGYFSDFKAKMEVNRQNQQGKAGAYANSASKTVEVPDSPQIVLNIPFFEADDAVYTLVITIEPNVTEHSTKFVLDAVRLPIEFEAARTAKLNEALKAFDNIGIPVIYA